MKHQWGLEVLMESKLVRSERVSLGLGGGRVVVWGGALREGEGGVPSVP